MGRGLGWEVRDERCHGRRRARHLAHYFWQFRQRVLPGLRYATCCVRFSPLEHAGCRLRKIAAEARDSGARARHLRSFAQDILRIIVYTFQYNNTITCQLADIIQPGVLSCVAISAFCTSEDCPNLRLVWPKKSEKNRRRLITGLQVLRMQCAFDHNTVQPSEMQALLTKY